MDPEEFDLSRCESPIERQMAEELRPLLHPRTQFRIQKVVKPYRIDMAASFANQHVGIECDGKHFHDFEVDRRRDMKILLTVAQRSIPSERDL